MLAETNATPFRRLRVISRLAWRHVQTVGVVLSCVALLLLSGSDRALLLVNRVPSVYSAVLCVGLFVLILPRRLAILSVPLSARARARLKVC